MGICAAVISGWLEARAKHSLTLVRTITIAVGMLFAGVIGTGFASVGGNLVGPFVGGLIRGHLSPFITWAIVRRLAGAITGGIGGPLTLLQPCRQNIPTVWRTMRSRGLIVCE